MRRKSFLRQPFVLLVIIICVWLTVLVRQHAAVQNIDILGDHVEQRPSSSSQRLSNNRNSERAPKEGRARASFNGIDLKYRSGFPPSFVECTGGNNRLNLNESWMFRSCKFNYLCFDMELKEHVLFRDPRHPLWVPTDNFTHSVALGGVNPRWNEAGDDKGVWKVRWFPRIKQASKDMSYYELPDYVVEIPFHSFAAHNVGHLLWDDFYPMFSLLRLFGIEDKMILPIRQKIPYVLYASCEKKQKRKICANNFVKFFPLMGVDPMTFSHSQDFRFLSTRGVDSPRSKYVCARNAVAGLGMLTDHGLRDHGWEHRINEIPHNLGRANNLYLFRTFLVNNVLGKYDALMRTAKLKTEIPKLVFSQYSSRDWDRRHNFTTQIDFLNRHLSRNEASIKPVKLFDMTLKEQVEMAASTSIFITVCGGGSMTATFLPKGASVIVYYNPYGGFDFHSYNLTGKPARLDWDLLNNAGYLRIHWLPISTMDQEKDLNMLLALVRLELQAFNGYRQHS